MANTFNSILVTGGSGFIGSNLVRWLLNNTEANVHNFDALTYAGNGSSLNDVAEHPRYSFHQGDIADKQAVNEFFKTAKPDAILHLAAESHVDRSIDAPSNFIKTNVIGTFTLLEAARKFVNQQPHDNASQFRFLHVSTDEVFGSLGPEGKFSETTPYSPRSPYSASKAASDHLARAWYHTYGLPVIVTNCSNNYGPYQFPEKLIPVVILKAIRGEPIPVYGSGENIRDWLYVEDHCRALYDALVNGQIGSTYNIGGNNELKNIDLVNLLCEILDEIQPREDGLSYSTQITFVNDRPGHDQRYAVDTSKIASELGWQPSTDDSNGFRQTVQWYLDNQDWWNEILDGSYQLKRQGTKKSLELK